MSQKRRRSRQGAEGPGAGDGPDGSAAEAPAEPAPRRINLPAFGFAADVLKRRDEPAAATSATAVEVDPLDPERIFAFADALDRQGEEDAEERSPQLLQTWVTLDLAGETFALPVEAVREVLRVAAITRVPHAPYPIRGVTNLRGRVIPVIDLRRRLELPSAEVERGSRVVVVESRGRLIGLLVDGVRQVVHVDLNRVQPPPDDVMTAQSDYILGVHQEGDGLVLLLDVDRVLIVKEAGAA